MLTSGDTPSKPESVIDASEKTVFMKSEPIDEGSTEVRGYDFDAGIHYDDLLRHSLTTGFQATNLALAIDVVNGMINARRDSTNCHEALSFFEYPYFRREKTGCTIFLGYTSNMISSGVRETIRYLVQHDLVDCIVTSAGGVEEDLMKCLSPTFVGDFFLDGKELRSKGINRIGNLLVPNDNYCKLENWILPILDQMLKEQNERDINWTPSRLIARLGQEMNHCESVCFWAWRNKIPIFCPALTDGSLGDMLYFHSYKTPGLRVDLVEDIRLLNDTAVHSVKSGMVLLGAGVIKHHICNANLMRNGADFTVFINTAQEFDGSDAGARPDEA
ncbi:unnamed protein product, partial [Soboliphyme baturini]|uniref:deoxyhypusine synthase n=1 Tax=Soboliphyme baturini TaxID=241478 RepID=A0A183J456_9BILA